MSEVETTVKNEDSVSVYTAYNRIPYSLLSQESDSITHDIIVELSQIMKYYKVYKKGCAFTTEGSGGHYVSADLRYKKVATLINKEARFLFGQAPDVIIKSDIDKDKASEETKDAIAILQSVLDKVYTKNMLESKLLKGAKDCFIGKRVALVVNANEKDGVTFNVIPAMDFLYEYRIGSDNVLSKFVCFITVKESSTLEEKRIFKKKYILESGEDKDVCYVEEKLYDGSGRELEMLMEYQPTLLDRIPAVVVRNDGLTGEVQGESEVEQLMDYEKWYSKLSNGDIDAERKDMNQIKYAVDMDASTTKNLPTGPGAFWDLTSDNNLDKPNPKLGTLENSMSYSQPLGETLSRIRASMYEEVDVPDVTLDNLQGVITSGKAMKCLYWPLVVRCQEKMKEWGPALTYITDVIVQMTQVYPECFTHYTNDVLMPVKYEIVIEQNYPLPEDETEEKTMDLAEVAQSTMSRKAYMKKWRMLSDAEADEELQQIAIESALLEGTNMEGAVQSNGFGEQVDEEVDEAIDGEVDEAIEEEDTTEV